MWDKKTAYRFIFLMGIVSLCMDIVYEGARSVLGQFMATLGASAIAVGVVAGVGEALGYFLRFLFGYLADRLRLYWFFTFLGYFLTGLSVPSMSLAVTWYHVALLTFMERLGKAIRNPARDTLLSYATATVGHGRGFGLHEFVDQLGAVSGPLLVAVLLGVTGSYRSSLALLILPALISLALLWVAYRSFPYETPRRETDQLRTSFPRTFFIYVLYVFVFSMSSVPFALIGYHLKTHLHAQDIHIPLAYSLAMAVDAVSALVLGIVFDRIGMRSLILGMLVSIPSVPIVFLTGHTWWWVGVVLWGAGIGLQESLLRSVIPHLTPHTRRGTAYGLLHASLGFGSFLGGLLLGKLYERSVVQMVIFSLALQFVSLLLLLVMDYTQRRAA